MFFTKKSFIFSLVLVLVPSLLLPITVSNKDRSACIPLTEALTSDSNDEMKIEKLQTAGSLILGQKPNLKRLIDEYLIPFFQKKRIQKTDLLDGPGRTAWEKELKTLSCFEGINPPLLRIIDEIKKVTETAAPPPPLLDVEIQKLKINGTKTIKPFEGGNLDISFALTADSILDFSIDNTKFPDPITIIFSKGDGNQHSINLCEQFLNNYWQDTESRKHQFNIKPQNNAKSVGTIEFVVKIPKDTVLKNGQLYLKADALKTYQKSRAKSSDFLVGGILVCGSALNLWCYRDRKINNFPSYLSVGASTALLTYGIIKLVKTIKTKRISFKKTKEVIINPTGVASIDKAANSKENITVEARVVNMEGA